MILNNLNLNISDTFNKELPSDPILVNTRRQVHDACYSFVKPQKPSRPQLLHYSDDFLEEIGLGPMAVQSKEFLNVFSGSTLLSDSSPYAMCYGGHQFGHWAGQLGDGRAINLAEVIHNDKRWTLQLKGAGETPYSRSADGLAVLRSSIREHLCSEAMHHLGVPTTRSLSLILTGDEVLRDILYDGHADYEKGAIVCRASSSFIRFGNFQLLATRQDLNTLTALTNYTIRHFYPHLNENDKNSVLELFREVVTRTMTLVIHWQRVGFVHGVLNTDNMSILGQTIDFGPYGWLEGFDHNWTPNTTDRQQKRYRFGYQPRIALWNLVQLGNALYPLVDESTGFEEILNQGQIQFHIGYQQMMRDKLGLISADENDGQLIQQLEKTLQLTETDMTIFFRKLSTIPQHQEATFEETFKIIQDAFYSIDEITESIKIEWQSWFDLYRQRLQQEIIPPIQRMKQMNAVNPKFVLRNYMAQLAIDAANKGEYGLIDDLYQLLKLPYAEQVMHEKWYVKRPEWARYKVGCSMLSCSS